MVGRTERRHQTRLRPVLDLVEHVHLVAALDAEQCRQHADRPRADHQRDRARPGPAGRDGLDLLPGLRHDAARLGEYAEVTELVRDLDGEPRVDPPARGPIAVQALDAPLGVLAVGAEVPPAGRAGRAGQRVRAADHADHQVAGLYRGVRRGRHHPAEGLVTEHQALVPVRRLPVATQHLAVGPADADQQALGEDRSLGGGRIGQLSGQPRVHPARDDAHRLHGDRTYPPRSGPARGGPAPGICGLSARDRISCYLISLWMLLVPRSCLVPPDRPLLHPKSDFRHFREWISVTALCCPRTTGGAHDRSGRPAPGLDPP